MNDRELLELAAKAAGVGGGWGDRLEYHNGAVDLSDMWILNQEEFCPWNPLTDDGDALRLVAALDLDVLLFPAFGEVQISDQKGSIEISESTSDDKMAAVRRAIVRAAAEIGKSL